MTATAAVDLAGQGDGAARTVFLHIGMHKTGTSAIQAALAGYDDGRMVYARFDEINHSLPIYTAFATDPLTYRTLQARGLSSKQILARRDRYRERFATELSRRDRVGLIVVGEDIGKLDPDGQRALLHFITERGWALRVFCYLRAPESFVASALQQRIKSGLADIPDRFDPRYRSRVDVFLQELKAECLCLRVYDRARLTGGDVVSDFCGQLGIAVPRRPATPRENNSLSLDALRLVLALNRSQPCYLGDEAIADARNALIADLATLYPGGRRLNPGLFAAHVARDDLDYLDQQFGITLTEDHLPAEQRLESLLHDIDAVDPLPLARYLEAPAARHGDRIWLVNRLFTRHLGRADVRRAPLSQGMSELLRAIRDQLWRVARKVRRM